MIKVYSYRDEAFERVCLKLAHFPDNTQRIVMGMDYPFNEGSRIYILWQYENDAELFTVAALKEKFSEDGWTDNYVTLILPYIPNARMDRVKDIYDTFTLKTFANLINSLHFSCVYVLDPHSNVSTALIDRVVVLDVSSHIFNVTHSIAYIETNSCGDVEYNKTMDNLLFFYPDEGAMKRYLEMFPHDYAFGIKRRDWKSGEILGLDVIGDEKVKGKSVLIIDDICSAGGTFLHSAKELRKLGAKNIYLYVTHAEAKMYEGDMFNTLGLVDHIFTTNSLGCHYGVMSHTNRVTYLNWKDGKEYESAVID